MLNSEFRDKRLAVIAYKRTQQNHNCTTSKNRYMKKLCDFRTVFQAFTIIYF